MRYSRQSIFPAIGKNGQALIRKSSVAIVGVGALGTVVANLLTRAGVGNIILIDRDIVELTNLQRQVIFTEKDIGIPKAVAARDYLKKVNSEIKIGATPVDLDVENAEKLFKKVDLVIDCSDNLYTRHLLDYVCYKLKKPWIHGAAIGDTGTLFVVTPKGPYFSDITKAASATDTCDTVGVLNPIVSIIGSFQANEAIKILTKQKHVSAFMRYNLTSNTLQKIAVKKKQEPPREAPKKSESIIKFCGSGIYQVKGKPVSLTSLKRRWKKLGSVKESQYALFFDKITLFKDGRALIKASSEERAKSLYNRYIQA